MAVAFAVPLLVLGFSISVIRTNPTLIDEWIQAHPAVPFEMDGIYPHIPHSNGAPALFHCVLVSQSQWHVVAYNAHKS